MARHAIIQDADSGVTGTLANVFMDYRRGVRGRWVAIWAFDRHHMIHDELPAYLTDSPVEDAREYAEANPRTW